MMKEQMYMYDYQGGDGFVLSGHFPKSQVLEFLRIDRFSEQESLDIIGNGGIITPYFKIKIEELILPRFKVRPL